MITKTEKREYSISDLSSEFDVTTRTLRFYEEKGFLTPRRKGRIRYFTAADRVRLRLILRGKRLGLSLQQSAEIIDLYRAPEGSKKQLKVLLQTLSDRRAQLEQQAADLKATLAELKHVETSCRQALEEKS
ncbi:MAG: MerR family DNA-binding transcriptional regulator [Pseudomonadota bacterium]